MANQPTAPTRRNNNLTIRLWSSRVSVQFTRRSLIATVAVALGLLAAVVASVLIGVSFGSVVTTLSGHGTRTDELILYGIRLPRLVTAIFVGLAFGAAGAIFQSITRNPLGSPDIIGFTMGASFGAVYVVLILNGGRLATTVGAIIGGLGTAALVYALAYRKGVQGYRLILVGIGVTGLLGAAVSYLLLKTDVRDAQAAYAWLVGSLNARRWEHAVWSGVLVTALLPVAMALSRRMRALEMGDDMASALGFHVEGSRRRLIAIGTILTAVAVSAAGPIGFVSLAAPQIMRRITAAPLGIFSSALMGSLILVTSDLATQRLFNVGSTTSTLEPPVGIVTACVGGAYLAWLLFRENRASRA